MSELVVNLEEAQGAGAASRPPMTWWLVTSEAGADEGSRCPGGGGDARD
ncbi:MAG: hypothetical protein IPK53_12485 [bacterium]|nr:hypothetical protein [bacterium]